MRRFNYILEYLSVVLAVTVVSSIASGCKPSLVSQSDAPIISQRKTACFGACPVYEIHFYADGRVFLKAEANIGKEGNFESKISRKKLDELIAQFEDANFFSFEEKYTSRMTDLPTTYLKFVQGAKSLEVKDYDGAPDRLRSLEAMVESKIKQLRWRIAIP